MTSIRVNMVPVHKNGYGYVASSQESFRPVGSRNDWQNFSYRYVVQEYKQITLESGELYGEDMIVLSPVSTVISAYKTGTEKVDGGEIAIGDEIVINDIEYVVTAKRYDEPVLIRK